MTNLREGSQNSAILKDLLKGRKITSLDALTRYGCLRLAARIENLRKRGYKIETQQVVTDAGKNIARYFIRKENR